MPSGSHGGGGGGSHGGGSFGGSHGGGGSHFGGSYYHGPRTPGRAPISFTYFNIGGGRYAIAKDDRSNIFSMIFFTIIIFIFAVVEFYPITSSINMVKKIKSDYIYYQDMIAYAEEHPERLIEGTVQTFYLNENCNKYYVTYYFYTDSNERVDGYTYSIYTYSQALAIKNAITIQLAVDEYPLTTQTDSINLDYKHLPLEQDGEYVISKNNITAHIVTEIFLDLIVILMIIYTIKKVKSKIEKVGLNGEIKPKFKYICTYCGAKLSENDTTCPKCGSSTIETIIDKSSK